MDYSNPLKPEKSIFLTWPLLPESSSIVISVAASPAPVFTCIGLDRLIAPPSIDLTCLSHAPVGLLAVVWGYCVVGGAEYDLMSSSLLYARAPACAFSPVL